MKVNELYDRVFNIKGERGQIHKAIQELSELVVELSKYVEGRDNSEEVIEELADAEIMIEQMKRLFDPSKVRGMKLRKLERLHNRLLKWEEEDDRPDA